ncbi:DUF5676 family membrane protein [Euryhalocaulis caribicus]|uniref:DUF5676 family membrane protein n=1 Tax=Euryhalocaulis caribicus TaxID=1161401 RepID=UPI0012689610|nr:DUF5676 family membrane protein [Euryhalocaulis caribicus]
MTKSDNRFHIVALGWALSVTLASIFILCALLALALPSVPISHHWVGLFTLRAVSSPIAWVEGVAGSVVFGWIAALVAAPIYNRIAGK